jgi:hypothetical protein
MKEFIKEEVVKTVNDLKKNV